MFKDVQRQYFTLFLNKKDLSESHPYIEDKAFTTTPDTSIFHFIIMETEVAISVTCLLIVIITAIFGNILVCVACITTRELRSYTTAFIVSLAISDILVGFVSMPVWVAVQTTGEPSMARFPAVYTMWLCADIFFGTASIMNLMFVSLDRLVAVTRALQYQSIMNRRRIGIAIVFLWLYSIIIALIKLVKWPDYPLFVSITAFFGPLLIIAVAYYQIFKVAMTHARSIRVRVAQVAFTSGLHRSSNRFMENFRRDIKAARTLSVIVGTFTLCWCPFFVILLMFGYFKPPGAIFYPQLGSVVKWLHYGNSAMNPVLYACLNQRFRSAFKRVLLTMYKKITCSL